jgi:hypothetical protein
MSGRFEGTNGSFFGKNFIWTLAAMIVIIIVLAALALHSPISQPIGERTPTPEPTELTEEAVQVESQKTAVITQEPTPFLDPEEIGHTDGIIFWSTLLVLIVVVATLREAVLCKK